METPLAVLQLQQENAKLQSDVVRMKSRRDQFMEESRNLRAEMVKLREAVVTRENDLLILRTQFDDTTCELEDLRHEVRWSSGQHSAHSQVGDSFVVMEWNIYIFIFIAATPNSY